jgi:putative tricarboxylic transport membrane protein
MGARLGDVAASAVLAALAGAACVGSWRLGLGDVHNPGPGFMPFAAAALLGAMALIQLARGLLSATRRSEAVRPFAASRWSTVAIVLGALIGFGVLIDRLGFALTTFLMLAVLFGVIARKRWWVALASALAIAVAATLAFRALGLQLPAGPLGL